jgi:hypothetical protein
VWLVWQVWLGQPRRSLPLGPWLPWQLLVRRLGSQLGWPLGWLRQLLLGLCLQRLQGSQPQTQWLQLQWLQLQWLQLQWLQLQWLQPFLRHWFEQLSLVFHRPEA